MEFPKIEINKPTISNIAESSKLEWLVANGLGGYASSSIVGMNTRKYHGLLVTSKNFPLERKVILSKFEEGLTVDNKTFSLSTNRYKDIVYPHGYQFLEKFTLAPFPEFVFNLDGVLIKKKIFMPHGNNLVTVFYTIEPGQRTKNMTLEIRPLIANRSIHSLIKEKKSFDTLPFKKGFWINFGNNEFLKVTSSTGSFFQNECWYWNFFYERDFERGEDCVEHLYNPGKFIMKINKKKEFFVVASFCEEEQNVKKLYDDELERKRNLLAGFFRLNKNVSVEDWVKWIVLASDAHLIRRYDKGASTIAGYHWFGEWGRDTFISLPGLCLTTGRFQDAKEILKTFSRYIKNGLVPNYIEKGINYSSVDASLWFISSVYLYFKKTKDLKLVKNLWKKMKNIMTNYINGTGNIEMDMNFLIKHGPGLTWMDVKINGKYVTPRSNAVEIQALWYNALKIMEYFSSKLKDEHAFKTYAFIASRAKESFLKNFWNGRYLKDTIDDDTIRPNQLIALNLPYRILDEEKERKVLKVVEKNLLTKYGIRTLARNNPNFHRVYSGNMIKRDKAYHQGTIWPWLLGSFIKAWIRIKKNKKIVNKLLKPFVEREIKKFGLGTLCEILDGDKPFESKGCISQAWSIAEILDCLTETIVARS